MTVFHRDVLRYDTVTGVFSVHKLLVEDDDANFNTSGLDPGPAATASIDGAPAQPFETLTSDHLLELKYENGGIATLSMIRYDNPADGFSYFIPFGLASIVSIESVVSYTPGSSTVFATPYADYGLQAAVTAGTNGNDFMAIGSKDDSLSGGFGDDTIYGLEGDDTIEGGADADFMHGGAGIDTLSYASAIFFGVTIDLRYGFASGGVAQGDTFFDFENIIGSTADDMLTGKSGANVIRGGNGNDGIRGEGGPDTLLGEAGDDNLEGGAGADTLDGGTNTALSSNGGDRLSYAGSSAGVTVNLNTNTASGGHANGDIISGFEHLIGSSHDDDLTAASDQNTSVFGGDGNDTLRATGGSSVRLIGGTGADTIISSAPAGMIIYADYSTSGVGVTINLATGSASGGDAAGDVLIDIHHLRGSHGHDVLVGDGGYNVIRGDIGFDQIEGGAGGDVLAGDLGRDLVSYESSDAGVVVDLIAQTATGGHANGDTISGFENARGSNHDDVLTARSDFDSFLQYTYGSGLFGLAGNDLIIGGLGVDTLDGGANIDTLSYELSAAGVTVDLGTNVVSGGDAEGDTISGFENAIGSASGDVLTGSTAANIIEGEDGDDTLSGLGSGDTLHGGGGHDSLNGGGGIDTLAGDEGNDTLIGGAGGDSLDGGADVDALSYEGSNAAVTVNLQAGTASGGHATGDTFANFEGINGSTHGDTLTGDAAVNVLTGNGGADTLDGRGSGDTLDGGGGSDILLGGGGRDTLIGGNNKDTMTGGAGDDTFVLRSVSESNRGVNRDIITDFLAGADKLDFSLIDANAVGGTDSDSFVFFTTAGQAFSGTPGEVRFFHSGGNTIVELNIDNDLAAEAQIELTGTIALSAGDIVV